MTEKFTEILRNWIFWRNAKVNSSTVAKKLEAQAQMGKAFRQLQAYPYNKMDGTDLENLRRFED